MMLGTRDWGGNGMLGDDEELLRDDLRGLPLESRMGVDDVRDTDGRTRRGSTGRAPSSDGQRTWGNGSDDGAGAGAGDAVRGNGTASNGDGFSLRRSGGRARPSSSFAMASSAEESSSSSWPSWKVGFLGVSSWGLRRGRAGVVEA